MKVPYLLGFMLFTTSTRRFLFDQFSDTDEKVQHHSIWNALETVYNITSLMECEQFHSCKNKNMYCRCDDLCESFKDCCRDKTSEFEDASLSSLISCITTSGIGPIPVVGKSVYMISKCPSNWTHQVVKTRCQNHHHIQNVFERTPISSSRTFLTYRNKYCAICNNVTLWEARAWHLGFDCNYFTKARNGSLSSLFESYMNNKHCYHEYMPPLLGQTPRRCILKSLSHVTNCHPSSGTNLCESYLAPIFIYINKTKYKSYQNIHCLKCDNNRIKDSPVSNLKFSCFGENVKGIQIDGMFNMFDFGPLLDWSPSSQHGVRTPCQDDEIFIQATGRCVQLHCPMKSTPYLRKCIPYSSVVNTALLDLLYYVNGSVDFQTVYSYIVSDITKMKNITSVVYSLNFEDMSIQMINGTSILLNDKCMFVKATCSFRFVGATTVRKIQNIANYFISNPKQLKNDVFITYTNNAQSPPCFTNQPMEDPYLISLFGDVISSHVISCPSIQVSIQQNVDGDVEELSHFVDTKRNESMNTYIIGDVIINASHVNVTKRGLFICLSIFERYYAQNVTSTRVTGFVSMVITYSSMSISIICLIITLFHYCIIPTLLTRYSVIILHLVMVLLVTHVLFMSKEMVLDNVRVCWWLALCLHFLFLLLFATMSLSLLQICLQLRSMQNPRSSKGLQKLIFRFILPGYLYATVIILTTVVLNVYTQPLEPWYGGETCFIRRVHALVYAFAVPVALCIMFNICIFSYVTHFICSIRYSTNKTLNTNRHYFLISLKLSTIIGIGWIFGFIAVFARMQWLIYAFEVTASLQGFFLSASLLSNHTVLEWYRQKLSGCRKSAD